MTSRVNFQVIQLVADLRCLNEEIEREDRDFQCMGLSVSHSSFLLFSFPPFLTVLLFQYLHKFSTSYFFNKVARILERGCQQVKKYQQNDQWEVNEGRLKAMT